MIASFCLSFAPEFFCVEGEPYDAEVDETSTQPKSVWQAIACMAHQRPAEWKRMAKSEFGLAAKDAKLLMAEAVLERIQETDTCTTLASPVEVWIDCNGDFRLEVW